MFPHPRMTLYIPCFTSHILVLCKITVASGSKRHDLLLAILLKHRIPLLLLLVRSAKGLEPHYN